MIATIEQAAHALDGAGDTALPSRWLKSPIRAAVQQEAVVVRLEPFDGRVIELTVAWDGSVAVAFASDGAVEAPLLRLATGDLVKRAWSVAARILNAYGARGSVHVAIATWDRSPEDVVAVSRWTEVRPPTEAELASVRRELQRAMGEYVLED
jgi:gentisate 1,2-dioxygenase